MSKRWIAAIGLAALLVLGAACSSKSTSLGGDGSPEPSASGGGTSAPPTTKGGGGGKSALTVKAESNFTFSPDKVDVKSGDTITVANASSFEHTFTVDGEDIDTAVSGGQSAKVTIGLSAGTYQFFCRFHGSPDSGMHGTLTVG